MLVRITGAGALDGSFGGGDGVVALPDDFEAQDVPAGYEPSAATRGRPLAVALDGILVAGRDSGGRAAVAKVALDGSGLVGAWGTSGVAVVSSDASAAVALALRPGGELVVAGTTVVAAGTGFFLAELSSGGIVTSGLDGDGLVVSDPTPAATAVDRVVDLKLQVSGAALLARDVVSTLGAPDAGGAGIVERYGSDGALAWIIGGGFVH